MQRWALCAAWLVFVLLLLEGASRVFWNLRFDLSLVRPDLTFAFYPELAALRPSEEPVLRVLVLGGPVLHADWGDTTERFETQLATALHRPVHVTNLARPGHTSRDSWLKYRWLDGREQRFDLVVFYHGINEARANNSPPDLFRDDYSHFSWYAHLERIESHKELPFLIAPYTIGYAATLVGERWGWTRHVPTGWPRPDWLDYGAEIRTERAFASNLGRILALARDRKEPVLLTTFAVHIARGYSRESFDAGRLAYAKHSFPIEMWGRPTNVRAAVERHNSVVRKVAERAQIVWVDVARQLPRGRRFFDDVCHLTELGVQQLVTLLVPGAVAALDSHQGPREGRPGQGESSM